MHNVPLFNIVIVYWRGKRLTNAFSSVLCCFFLLNCLCWLYNPMYLCPGIAFSGHLNSHEYRMRLERPCSADSRGIIKFASREHSSLLHSFNAPPRGHILWGRHRCLGVWEPLPSFVDNTRGRIWGYMRGDAHTPSIIKWASLWGHHYISKRSLRGVSWIEGIRLVFCFCRDRWTPYELQEEWMFIKWWSLHICILIFV